MRGIFLWKERIIFLIRGILKNFLIGIKVSYVMRVEGYFVFSCLRFGKRNIELEIDYENNFILSKTQ